MTAPAVSVVLPVHDGERWLREAVASVLAQTFVDFELIVVDDGSTDSSARVLADLAAADPRVRVLSNERNLGLIATLNRGFAAARGRYIARLDADDVALPNRLERQVAAFEADPVLGVLGTAYYRIDEHGRRRLRVPPGHDTAVRWRLLFGNIWCHSSMMLRASLLDGEREPYRPYLHAEDYELWVRLLRCSRGATLQEPLVLYREHGASVSHQHERTQRAMMNRVAAAQISELLEDEILDDAAVEALRRAKTGSRAACRDPAVVDRLWRLLQAYARQPGIEPRVVRRIERRWIGRVCARAPARTLRALARSGSLAELWRRAPGPALRGLVLGRGGRSAAALARRVRA